MRYAQPLPSSSLYTVLEQKDIIHDDMPRRLKDYHVEEWLIQIITKQYNRQRTFHRLPPVSVDMKKHQLIEYLREDYRKSDRVLEAWSVMFVRYAGVLSAISTQEHEAIAQTTERTLRRRQIYGLKLLHLHILLR